MIPGSRGSGNGPVRQSGLACASAPPRSSVLPHHTSIWRRPLRRGIIVDNERARRERKEQKIIIEPAAWLVCVGGETVAVGLGPKG